MEKIGRRRKERLVVKWREEGRKEGGERRE